MVQTVVNGIIAGALYALVAVGFSLVYRTQRFFYIAHGGALAVAAFGFWLAVAALGSVAVGIALAATLAILVAMANELLIHRPLRRRGSPALVLFLASTAAYFIIENGLLTAFGPDVKTIPMVAYAPYEIGSIRVTPINLLSILVSVACCAGLYGVLHGTRMGWRLRAVADNESLAAAYGVNVFASYGWAITLSGVLAAAAGIVIALETHVRFSMAMAPVLKGIAAALLGGVGNIAAAAVGGLAIGLAENAAVWILPSGYKDVVAFSIIVLMLYFRPHGIAGVRERAG